jgi:hypothetical protein
MTNDGASVIHADGVWTVEGTLDIFAIRQSVADQLAEKHGRTIAPEKITILSLTRVD